MAEAAALEETFEWTFEGMTLDEAVEKWPELAEKPRELQRRAKLSVTAQQRHRQVADPDTGRRVFGGPQPGSGRPRKQRVAERIAELASGERQKDVVDALFSGLSRRNSAAVRRDTAVKIVEIERRERELQIDEEVHETRPRDELEEKLAKTLAKLGERGELPDNIRALVEGARRPYDVDATAEPD